MKRILLGMVLVVVAMVAALVVSNLDFISGMHSTTDGLKNAKQLQEACAATLPTPVYDCVGKKYAELVSPAEAYTPQVPFVAGAALDLLRGEYAKTKEPVEVLGRRADYLEFTLKLIDQLVAAGMPSGLSLNYHRHVDRLAFLYFGRKLKTAARQVIAMNLPAPPPAAQPTLTPAGAPATPAAGAPVTPPPVQAPEYDAKLKRFQELTRRFEQTEPKLNDAIRADWAMKVMIQPPAPVEGAISGFVDDAMKKVGTEK